MDRKVLVSAGQGAILSIFAALGQFGIIGGPKGHAIEGVALSLLPLVAALAVRSARAPRP